MPLVMTEALKKETPFSCPACGGTEERRIAHKNGYDLLRCVACKTVCASPFPSPEELSAFYQAYASTSDYVSKQDSKLRRCLRRLRPLVRKAPGKRFLDVGCNHGFAVAAAHQLGFHARGIDIDAVTIEACRKRFPDAGAFEAVTVQDYAARGEQADVVYTSEVIEHTLDPNSFAQALARILVPNGLLYLTAPDGAHPLVPRDFVSWNAAIPPEHLVYFSRRGITQLLERNGFYDVKIAFNLKPGLKLTARRR